MCRPRIPGKRQFLGAERCVAGGRYSLQASQGSGYLSFDRYFFKFDAEMVGIEFSSLLRDHLRVSRL